MVVPQPRRIFVWLFVWLFIIYLSIYHLSVYFIIIICYLLFIRNLLCTTQHLCIIFYLIFTSPKCRPLVGLLSPRCWHTALSHLGWTTPTHCWVARRPATSTDCRWHWIHLPELYVRHRVPPAPPNYDGSSTGCLFDSGSLTSSWLIQPMVAIWNKTIFKLAVFTYRTQSRWSTWSNATTHLVSYDQQINCYCLYHGWQQ